MALTEVVRWLDETGAPLEAILELGEWVDDLSTLSGPFKEIDWATTDVLMREGMSLYNAIHTSRKLSALDR
jgi:hypothetical protein